MEEEEENKFSTLNNSFLHQVEDSITEGKLLGGEEYPNMAANSDDSKLDTFETPVVEPLAEDEITEEDNKTEVKEEPSVVAEGDEHDEAAVEEIPTTDTKIKTDEQEQATELSDTPAIGVYSLVAAQIETEDSALEMEPPPVVEPEPLKDDGEELELLQESLPGDAEPSIAVNHNGVGDTTADDETPIDLKFEEEPPTSPKLDEKTPADPELDEKETSGDTQKDDEETPAGRKLDEEEAFDNTQKEEETPADLKMDEEETAADLKMDEEETPADTHKEKEQIPMDSKMEKETLAEMDEETPANMHEEEEEIPVDPQIEEETPGERKMEEGEDVESEDEELGKESGDDSPVVGGEEEEDEAVAAEEETPSMDTEMDTEADMAELGKGGGGKRKRGKNPKGTGKATGTRKKTVEEDVCFICFDGGELVLCDRRGCPKAYHPSCVNRDEAFFKAKGRWNCGWHQCSICEKNAQYMCYTCTYSLCKGCIKDAVILCVRGNKGFCESCMKTVMLIENEEQGNKEVDFNDRSSWEYLFKDYWLELKEKLSLSLTEISQAKNPKKGSDPTAAKHDEPYDVNTEQLADSASENSSENLEERKPKKRKGKKLSKSLPREQSIITRERISKGASTSINTEWASNELLEFVMHMRNGDKSALSQFDVQAMLLEYIKRNKLRDPRRKSQIICDVRLQNLFGKSRVGHFEMLKLLESHFLLKEDSQMDDIQDNAADTDTNMLDADASADITKGGKEKKRKTRKKGGGPQSNVEDYAAIDTHNINLIYLRRKLVEDLLEDTERFNEKVVGTFVRIRIPGNNLKQDIYRLVQVVGTSKAASPYKVSKRTTDIMLEILNLDKNEVVSIDSISNQEFTEDECKRLRQSIKCGLINRLTVGDILDKAMETQAARVNDWIETEIVRLSHLRDRASEKGRRKELRECVEKLQVLKTPEERRRRLEEITEIHADPKMDPTYESEDNGTEMEEDTKREVFARPRGSSFSRRAMEPISPGRGGSELSPKDSWGGNRKNPGKKWEINRNLSNRNIPIKPEESTPNFDSWSQRREKEVQRENNNNSIEISGTHSAEPNSLPANLTTPAPAPAPAVQTAAKFNFNETDKMWHYKDPSGKAQGPFSMAQLRKWNSTGYFPDDLKIWRAGKETDFILLTDALEGKLFPAEKRNLKSNGMIHQLDHLLSSSRPRINPPSVEIPKVSVDSLDNSSNLPSPTPKQNSSLQSPTPDNTQSLLRSSMSLNATLAPPTSLLNTENTLPQMYSHSVPAPETTPNMVQSVNQGWVQNSTMNVPGQQAAAAYAAQWAGVQSTVPQPNAAPWGVGPDNLNTGWMTMPGNPNMVWVGPVPGNTNMNWAPTTPGWVIPQPGSQGFVPGNWVAQPSNTQPWAAPTGPVNGNPGWAPLNPVPNPNQGWVGGIVNTTTNNNNNQGPVTPGNANQSWGSTDRFSGRRDNNRNWNRQSGNGSGGGSSRSPRICSYFENGSCKKGSSCDYKHN